MIRDRVVGFERIPGSQLVDHPLQNRLHGSAQRTQLDAVLDEIGIAGVLVAYYSPSTGALTTINGHMRKDSHPTLLWPTLILDVNDEEAATLLAVYDPLSANAHQDPDHTARLLESITTRSAVLNTWLAQMREENELAAHTRATLSREGAQARPKLKERDTAIRVVLFVPEVRVLEAAIRLAGQKTSAAFPNRGEAFTEICRFYLEHATDASPEG